MKERKQIKDKDKRIPYVKHLTKQEKQALRKAAIIDDKPIFLEPNSVHPKLVPFLALMRTKNQNFRSNGGSNTATKGSNPSGQRPKGKFTMPAFTTRKRRTKQGVKIVEGPRKRAVIQRVFNKKKNRVVSIVHDIPASFKR